MKIGIVGLGLMGGSIASALKSHHHIFAYDRSPEAVAFALSKGIIDEAFSTPKALFLHSEIIYLCLYPLALADFIKTYQEELLAGTVLVEISGVKSEIIHQIDGFLRPDIDLVYTHPVAGREKQGVVYSKPEIFQGANYIIVPTPKNQPNHLHSVALLAKEMGFGTLSNLTAEEHDSIIAYTSQLTHILSLALVESDDQRFDTKRFIGDSYRDLTRISLINEALWSELFLTNKKHLLERVKNFRDSLDKYVELLEHDDLVGLQKLMRETREKRNSLEAGEK
jgi:prephenate dehydrogenase